LPEWAALDEELLNLTHSLVLDQCRKGQGYPVALSESHEQAVVTGVDRKFLAARRNVISRRAPAGIRLGKKPEQTDEVDLNQVL